MPANVKQIRHLIVMPALMDMAASTGQPGWGSKEAVELVMATGYAESRYEAIRQYARSDGRRGPARGMWQCEPATHRDYWRWIKRRGLVEAVANACGYLGKDDEALTFDLRYQALMCRIHYRRIPTRLPDTYAGMAEYWKKYYNTSAGSGTIGGFVAAHRQMRRIEPGFLL